ncbi:MAG: hypothetical protein AB7F76_17595 [Parvibaculaceae bacterium]
MQQECSYMPVFFNSTVLRATLRRDRRQSVIHMVRVRFRKWQRGVQQRKREQALAECLSRLDRRTLDDIGLGPASGPASDVLVTETEIHAVRNRARGIT